MVPNSQKIKVSLTFEYEAPIYEGDPDDAYEIAQLEGQGLTEVLEDNIGGLYDDFHITSLDVSPVLIEKP